MSVKLTADIAKALGVPPKARKAVLTLEKGKAPVLEVELFVVEGPQSYMTDTLQLANLRFRLEPIDGA